MKTKIYSSDLENLQELREQARGSERKEIQQRIDDIFLKNPPKVRKKKKKIRMPKDPDDMWY